MTTRLEKPIRRVLEIRGRLFVVELSRAGVLFREHGRRRRVVAPMRLVLELAERIAGEELRRERLRTAAVRRFAR